MLRSAKPLHIHLWRRSRKLSVKDDVYRRHLYRRRHRPKDTEGVGRRYLYQGVQGKGQVRGVVKPHTYPCHTESEGGASWRGLLCAAKYTQRMTLALQRLRPEPQIQKNRP